MVFQLYDRIDRTGSCFLSHVSQIIIARHRGFDKVSGLEEWLNEPTVMIRTFKELYPHYSDGRFDWHYNGDVLALASEAVLTISQDLVSKFREHLFLTIFPVYKRLINEANIKSLIPSRDKLICLHLRLDDVTRLATTLFHESFFTISKQIDDGKPTHHDLLCGANGDQAAMAESQVLLLISKLTKIYPNHEVHLITSPIGECNITQYPVHRDNEDASLWYLINCDVLVASRSNFSLMAGFLHQGSKVYCPTWGHAAAAGLGSKYNKSNWTFFDDVTNPNDIIFL
jgi:hypothetical protein